jgi:hypothetical protein
MKSMRGQAGHLRRYIGVTRARTRAHIHALTPLSCTTCPACPQLEETVSHSVSSLSRRTITENGPVEWQAPTDDWKLYQPPENGATKTETRYRHRDSVGTASGTRARRYFEEKSQKRSPTEEPILVPPVVLPSRISPEPPPNGTVRPTLTRGGTRNQPVRDHA